MLFNSQEFILLFIPALLVLLFLIRGRSHNTYIATLILFSLIFYSFWNVSDLLIVLMSVLFNYVVYKYIRNTNNKYVLIIGILFNLVALYYYKYIIFTLSLIGINSYDKINLPLGISFFTFTQIVFLIDVYKNKYTNFKFNNYLLFVVYFPHLIAGPLVHHKDLIPQFENYKNREFNQNNILIGLVIFTIGLAKKVLFADNLALYANSIFNGYSSLQSINAAYAWTGAVAYSMQLYFDFSGYTDMAIGVSKILNINLPINFNSPYKSKNIIEFWRRWHITLSNFLRDYLYIPLGGNKNRIISISITMALGGLWHGANLTFLVWGCLHAGFIYLNYLWIKIKEYFKIPVEIIPNYIGVFITFICVTFAWVFFRSENLQKALAISSDMIFRWLSIDSLNLFINEFHIYLRLMSESNLSMKILLIILILSSVIIWVLPNTQQYINQDKKNLCFKGGIYEIIFFGILFLASVLSISSKKEFIYFNF